MSKIFKRFNKDFKPTYPEDLKNIRVFLERHGILNCTDEKLENLWYRFSGIHDAVWLGVDDNENSNFWLNRFMDWVEKL